MTMILVIKIVHPVYKYSVYTQTTTAVIHVRRILLFMVCTKVQYVYTHIQRVTNTVPVVQICLRLPTSSRIQSILLQTLASLPTISHAIPILSSNNEKHHLESVGRYK